MSMNDIDPARPLLPKTGWLSKYVKLTDGLAACPRFRFFAALSILGAAINNKIYLQRGTKGTLLPKIFPNPWVILLAPPGRGYKTSTINMAVNILTKGCPEVRILSDKITPEAIVQALAAPQTPKEMIRIGPRDATGLIKAPELSVFFGKQQYNTSLVSLITDLYDYRETWKAETIGRGQNVLKNVCLSILGGSTPAWLQHMLPQDAFTGGFMSRFILVEMPPTYYKRVAYPPEPPQDEVDQLIEQLTYISHLEGMMIWDDDGRERYREIYEGYMPIGEAQMDAYKEREPEQILRTAMLFALSHERMVVTQQDLDWAFPLIKVLENETNPRIERLVTNPRMSLTQEIMDILTIYNPIKESDLLNKVYRSLTHGEAQFYEALSILMKIGKIEKTGKPGSFVVTKL